MKRNFVSKLSFKVKIQIIVAVVVVAGVVGAILFAHAVVIGSLFVSDTVGTDKRFKKSFDNETGAYFRKIADDLDLMRKAGNHFELKIAGHKGVLIHNPADSGTEDVFPDWSFLSKKLYFNKEFYISYVLADEKKVLFDFGEGRYLVIYSLNGAKPVLPEEDRYENIKKTTKLAEGWYYYRF